MSYRYDNAFINLGLNTLVSPTPSYTYGLWGWGKNNFGQLGLGNRTYYSSPKQVGALTTWSSIAASSHTLALKTDGTLWSWGQNNFGQLGLGNTTYYSSPKQIGVLTTWSSITAGSYHTLALKTDGTLWSWGFNSSGQLGLGNITYYSSPKQVGALTKWGKLFKAGYTTSSFVLQIATTTTPYTRYGGIWKLNAASAAKGAGTWSG